MCYYNTKQGIIIDNAPEKFVAAKYSTGKVCPY